MCIDFKRTIEEQWASAFYKFKAIIQYHSVPDEETKHPAGYHIYPFSVTLPSTIPSSFEGRRGYIRYQCVAFIDRGWKGLLDCDLDFTVIRHLDLNTVQNVEVRSFL